MSEKKHINYFLKLVLAFVRPKLNTQYTVSFIELAHFAHAKS